MGVEPVPNALGGKAYMYVHLVALGTGDAVNEGLSMQVKGSVKVYGVLDAVEYNMCFPKAFGQALQ